MEQEERKAMSDRKDGGPAFPAIEADIGGNGQFYYFSVGGMTLRDWFAGQALIGWFDFHAGESDTDADQNVAARCYRLADVMLKAR